MFKEIKYYLSKITRIKKTGLILLSFFVLFGLFLIPRPANADFFGIADSFWGLLESQLDALDFGEGTVLQLIFFLMLLLAESQAFLYFTAKLFQWAIDFPIHLGITPANPNPLVASGWAFTSGFVNILFILIFVVIALAYILRIETFGAKKALPRLIIVALLLNFSLVFIGMAVDITQLTLNSIITALGGSDLPTLAMAPLAQSIDNFAKGYIAIMTAYLVVALIPFANVAGLAALITAFIAEAYWGTLSLTILLIILGFGLGIIFLFYFVLFMIRVSMIWMLAILSPLAFACWILPGTQKYWKQWLQLLVEWLVFGIIVVLLMGLGLRLFAENTVIPGTGPIKVGPVGSFPAFTYNYLFLLIYLGVMFYYSKKKFAPELATVLIGQATGLAKRGAPMARMAMGGARGWVRGQLTEHEKLREGVKGWAKAEAWGTGVSGRRGILMRGVGVPFAAMQRRVGVALGPAIIEEEKKKISRAEEETDKIKEPSLAFSKFRDNIEAGRLAEAIGSLSQSIKKGGGFKALFEKEVNLEEAVTLAQRANRIGAVPEAERIARAFIGAADRMNFEPLSPDDTAKGYTTIQDKLIGEAKRDEVKDFAKGFWKASEAMRAVQKFWGGPQLRKAAEEFGRGFIDDFMKPVRIHLEKIRDLGVTDPAKAEKRFKSFVHINPRKALYLATTSAQEFGYESIWEQAPEVIKTDPKYKNIKDIVAERP